MTYGILLLASLLLPQSDGGDPVARWAFDGDVRDSGPKGVPTKAVGRLEFIDSPVGGSGKAAVFNGVDAFVQVEPSDLLGVGSGDFTISLWLCPLERRPSTLLARKGWSLLMKDGGILSFESSAGMLTTGPGAVVAGGWHHVVVSVTGPGSPSHLYVNGDLAAVGPLQAATLDGPPSPLVIGRSEDGKLFTGILDDLRLYAKGAPKDQKLTEEGMPWLLRRPASRKPFDGKFELLEHDVVAFVGGENARVGLDLGYLETLLSLRSAGRSVRFRNMAWEGDTVHEQQRPVNFGSWTDQLRRAGVTVLFVQFGQLEALEGKAGVGRFVEAYETLLNQFTQTTSRIVMVSPTPFGKGSSRQPDLSARNDDLKLYVEASRALAAKRGFLFVDLTTRPLSQEGLTRDGLHLTTAGQWAAARETLRQLQVAGLSDLDEPNPQGAFPREAYESVRTAVRAKNALWNNAWRPANWAFLGGDRMEQPSSRDHLDRRVRWFPVEIQQYPAMIRRDEEKIEALIQASEKK